MKRYADPLPAGFVHPDPDCEYEKQREIRHLGAASGWPCQALDDAEADEQARLDAHYSDIDWSDYYVVKP